MQMVGRFNLLYQPIPDCYTPLHALTIDGVEVAVVVGVGRGQRLGEGAQGVGHLL